MYEIHAQGDSSISLKPFNTLERVFIKSWTGCNSFISSQNKNQLHEHKGRHQGGAGAAGQGWGSVTTDHGPWWNDDDEETAGRDPGWGRRAAAQDEAAALVSVCAVPYIKNL